MKRNGERDFSAHPMVGGFSMLELIIVVSIIAVLFLAATLILDPLQILARAWDDQRVQEAETLTSAIRSVRHDIGGSFDPDGPFNADADTACSGESDQRVFVSVPSDNGESDPDDLPDGWSYARATEANLQKTDGTGWLPVDFDASSVAGLSHLPVDPANTFASGFYYSYVCSRTPTRFELIVRMNSEKFRTGGSHDVQSADGGDDIFVLEKGDNLELDPKAPIGYWGLNGNTTGNIADGTTGGFEDSSGRGIHGTMDNASGSDVAWVEGVLDGAVRFDGDGTVGVGDSRVDLGSSTVIHDGRSRFSVCAWVKPESLTPQWWDYQVINRCDADGDTGCWELALGDYSFPNDNTIRLQAYENPGWQNYSSTTDVSIDEWTHVCGGTTTSTDTIFRNGYEDTAAGSYEIPEVASGVPQSIGNEVNGAGYLGTFHGSIDEVGVYDRVLAVAEVEYHYECLKP